MTEQSINEMSGVDLHPTDVDDDDNTSYGIVRR
jgi:hypothetical protein